MRNEWKLLISAALAALSSYMQRLAVPFLFLFLVMLVDYGTGMAKAWIRGEISSRMGVQGVIRKVGRLCLVCVGAVIDYIIRSGIAATAVELPFEPEMPFGLIVCFWLIICECISILENLDAAGVDIPEFLRKALQEGKHTIDGKMNGERQDMLKEEEKNESD